MADITEKPQRSPSGLEAANEKTVVESNVNATVDHSGSDSDEPFHKDAQAGVQNMEATTSAWTRTSLIIAYVMIWVIYFVDSMQNGATGALTPWVTSSFQKHSLTPTVSIMSQIIGGVFKLTIAKILDVFGRPQGYAFCVVFTTMGLVMMAACQNVETYAAAQVIFWVGFNGIGYCMSIVISDTSSLRNRGLMFAFSNSPYIITTWLAGPISEAFLEGPGFRWGFGVFCIITPVVTMPLYFLLQHNFKKAKAMGLVPERKSDRTFLQSIYHYGREFDIIGLLILSAGLGLFLLSFNLYSFQADGWKSPMIICFIVIGGLLLIGFACWEKWVAPVKFIPYSLLLDRTMMGSCIVAACAFISYYIWYSYFSSFLQVVNGLSVTEASYVTQIYSVGSCFWAIIVGLCIRRTGKFKWLTTYFGIPVAALGVGLMIAFRQPGQSVGLVVMCQILIAFAGGTVVICEQVAALAAGSHQYVAVILAIQHMCANIGGGIGLTVSSAIWTSVFPQALAKHLPEEELENLPAIYGGLGTQLSYPLGSPTRDAIQRAYGDAQRNMLIAATAIYAVAWAASFAWRDINVKNHKQVKGVVF